MSDDNLFSHAVEARHEATAHDEAPEGTTMPVFSHQGT